jgi:hypothetical protein
MNYRVSGYIRMESTGEEASYEVIIEDYDFVPNAMDVFDYLVASGDIQIIPTHWEEVDEFGVGV